MSPNIAPDPSQELPRSSRYLFTAAWTSFLAASVTTMIFFAFVDPSPVAAVLAPTALIPDRLTLYSLGFLFFWTSCALAAGLTAWLLTPPET